MSESAGLSVGAPTFGKGVDIGHPPESHPQIG